MIPDELLKLLIKTGAQLLCVHGKVKVICTFYAEHTEHPLLQSLVIVLQGKV